MIVRPPPNVGFRLFRPPVRQVISDDPRSGAAYFDGVWWAFRVAPVRDDRFERALGHATAAYYQGDYERTITVLDHTASWTTKGTRAWYDIEQARTETLIVMGRHADGRAALETLLSLPRSLAQFPRRCWLYGVAMELGDLTSAAEELQWLESEEHAASSAASRMITLLADFLAFLGDLDRAERHLARCARIPESIKGAHWGDLEGYARSTEYVALRGAAPERAQLWVRGLVDRILSAVPSP